MIRRPPRSTLSSSSAASDVYKRQGAGRRVDQAAFDGDDNGNPVAAVGGSPTLPNKDGRDSPHQHNGGGKSVRRFNNPQQEGKALFADSATSSVVHTGNGVDVVVTKDAFAGGGRRVKTAKKSGASTMGCLLYTSPSPRDS
eukprot:TRINITY_DN7176_c0_g1_i1.p1 TRINITY_DN7176_c0_g1~~TRINITY_DN7176_c0_g1_i1.p1  ORF type:complete len:141 (+),score=38.09 TRINITY_DN7176_c0_g1_i1:118-540(+)